MDGRRTALIVASDEFEHAGLSRLQAPSADAEALARVLGDPDIGGFDVRVVHNSPSHTVQARVEDLFAEGKPDDLLLLHFSGHGLKSDSGELFFAATNTRPDRLASTAVSADFVQRCMRGSRARSIVLFLDCCYGGAFSEGVAVRAAGPANVLESFPAGKLGGGRGRAVITASSAMEYAFEGSALASDEQRQPSVFTAAVVEGLSTGAADRDEDGLVSLTELYDYVFDQVRAQNPNQTPSRDIELQGDLYLAKSLRRRVRPLPLPPDVTAALEDANMYTRLGAVSELSTRLASEDLGIALGAHEALANVARSDIRFVSQGAAQAMAAASPAPSPSTLDFGDIPVGSPPPTREVGLGGPPIARAAGVGTDAEWLVVERVPGGVRVSVVASEPGEYAATLTLTSQAGAATSVPVTARLVPAPVPLSPAVPSSAQEGHTTPATATAPAEVEHVVADPIAPPGESDEELSPRPGPEPAAHGLVTDPEPRSEPTPDHQSPEAGAPADPSGTTAPEKPAPHTLADDTTTKQAPPRLPSWCGGLALGAGLLIALSSVLHYYYDTSTWHLLPEIRSALLGVAIAGMLAGLSALWLRTRPDVGPGLLGGVAAAALLNAVGFLADPNHSWDSRRAGWWLAVVGHLALFAAGVGALVWFQKAHVVRPRSSGPLVRWTLWVLATVCSALLVIMGALASDGSEDELGSALIVYGVAALAVPVALMRVRSEAGRRWALVGWVVAAVGPLLSLWNLLDHEYEWWGGMPITILSILAIGMVPFVERWWTQRRQPTHAP